ncbi:MAG: ECF-type sigma factor [Isosphaeraceae bacterium]
MPPMNDVARIFCAIETGDRQAADQLLPLVYDPLRRPAARKLAHEKAEHTLQAAALVHEAYLRLVGSDDSQGWESRGHFFDVKFGVCSEKGIDADCCRGGRERRPDRAVEFRGPVGRASVPACESPCTIPGGRAILEGRSVGASPSQDHASPFGRPCRWTRL